MLIVLSIISIMFYYFGLELYKKLNIPIGLITSGYGASLIEALSTPSVINSYNKMNDFLFKQNVNFNPGKEMIVYNKDI